MELIISETADLLTVAAILVKNGYTVKTGKRPVKPGSKVNVSVLIVEMEGKNG